MITQPQLKELLLYNPETGVFIWRESRGRVRKGSLAGRIKIHGRISTRGYREIGVNDKLYRAARLAFLYMTGEFPRKEVDHKNRVRDDDAWDNLRDVSHLENVRNR